MEVESHSEDKNFECQKRRLFETAEWTLLRLNQTINEMKSWSREREILTSDIHRLKIALGYSEKLLGDPLVMHQSQEIHRLERMNNDMRMKVESMSVALMNAERTVSWNVERKVRSEMAAFKCQVAEEKLHLAREIARLRSRLNEAEVDCSVYHEIRGKLDAYVEGDRYFDTIIAEAARKLIDTVCQLSSQLIQVARDFKIGDDKNEKVSKNMSQPQKSVTNGIDVDVEEISNKMIRLQEEKEVLSTEMNKRIDKIVMEKELKVRALKRVASSLRTKLIISLGRNKKLCKRLSVIDSRIQEKGNVFVQTSENSLSHPFDVIRVKSICSNNRLITPDHNHNDNHHVQDFNNELIKIIEEKDKLMDQLEMERTTTREALKEFEKSVRETEEKNKEVKKLQITLFSVKKNLKKSKIENKLMKKIDKKLFFNKIKMLKIKYNKLTNELEKYKEKLNEKEERINLLELEKNYLITEKLNLSKKIEKNSEIMKIEVFSQTSEIFNDKVIELNEEMNVFDIKKLEDDNNMLKNVDEEEIETLNKKLADLKIKNAESRAIEPSNTDDTRAPDIPQTMLKPLHDVKHVSKEDKVTMSTVLPNSICDSLVSQEEFTRVENFFSTENVNSEGINNVDKHQWIIEESKPEEMESIEQEKCSNSREIGFDEKKIFEKNGMIDKNIFDDLNNERWSKIMRGNWTIKNKSLRDSIPDMIMRNLEETDRELSSVKSELSSVRGEIGSLRRELESRRSKNNLLERENVALKEELGVLRRKILRVQEENRGLIKLGRIGGKL